MNSKTIVRLLFVFTIFASCLPAPRHFLVETEDGGETKGKIAGGKDYGLKNGMMSWPCCPGIKCKPQDQKCRHRCKNICVKDQWGVSEEKNNEKLTKKGKSSGERGEDYNDSNYDSNYDSDYDSNESTNTTTTLTTTATTRQRNGLFPLFPTVTMTTTTTATMTNVTTATTTTIGHDSYEVEIDDVYSNFLHHGAQTSI